MMVLSFVRFGTLGPGPSILHTHVSNKQQDEDKIDDYARSKDKLD